MNKFPPKILLELGIDHKSISNLLSLLKSIQQNNITLGFGAGVSASVGLPTWEELLRKIAYSFFTHWEFEINQNKKKASIKKPPNKLSIAFTEFISISEDSQALLLAFHEHLWGHNYYKINVDEAFNELLNNDILLIAQEIKNCIKPKDWQYLLRKAIYSSYEDNEFIFKPSSLYHALEEFVINSDSIHNIINYNYDDTFQLFINNSIKSVPIYKDIKANTNNFNIYYPHGYMPFQGGPMTEIILAENEYHQEALNPNSWSNLIQISLLNSTSCIFFGSSLKDPNLRRLLKLTNSVKSISHYCFLPTIKDSSDVQIMCESLFDFDLMKLGVKTIRYSIINNSHEQLIILLDILSKAIKDNSYIWNP